MSAESIVRSRVQQIIAADRGGVLESDLAGGVLESDLYGGKYCKKRFRSDRGNLRCAEWEFFGKKPKDFMPSGPRAQLRRPTGLPRRAPGGRQKYNFTLEDLYDVATTAQQLSDAQLDRYLNDILRGSALMSGGAARAGAIGGRRPRLLASEAHRLRRAPRRGGALYGGRQSAYIRFLKDYACKHRITYGEAMQEVRRKGLWKGSARGAGVSDLY